jgi:hypothetical protein
VLKASTSLSARRHADTTEVYARQRLKASGPGSMTKKFVNVAAGRADSAELSRVEAELAAAGFDGLTSVVKGPLVCATRGRKITLMPLSSGTSFPQAKKHLTEAFEAANSNPLDEDPGLDLPVSEARESARWSSHAFRRRADTRLRDYCVKYGVAREKVDAAMGWKEAERLKDMQTQYDTVELVARIRNSAITLES